MLAEASVVAGADSSDSVFDGPAEFSNGREDRSTFSATRPNAAAAAFDWSTVSLPAGDRGERVLGGGQCARDALHILPQSYQEGAEGVADGPGGIVGGLRRLAD